MLGKRVVLWMVWASAAASAAIDFSGVSALAKRLGGEELAGMIAFEEWCDETGEKAQIVPGDGDGGFAIRATSVHAASLALGVYLRDVAKGHVSWCGKRMPATWALPETTIDVAARFPYAMAYNYCTLSYTMAFWDEAAWQNEIDRLALSGYTHALVMAGVQKIWSLTLADMGYTPAQRQDFITDDAVQAWWLMGNLQALGDGTEAGRYPVVSDEMIEKDAAIGRFVYGALRAVGIEPVVQGFIGLVPSSTTAAQIAGRLGYDQTGVTDDATADETQIRIFRNGDYVAGQKNPDLIDPTCAAFKVFSDTWNANLKTVYGLEDAADYPKFLGGDLFHESAPPSGMTTEQKVNCAKFVQQYQQEAFPGVTWVLQSWQGSPDQNLRNGLDPAKTLIQRLDQGMNGTGAVGGSYHNETTDEYLPWIWAEVMNFGGNTGMHGAFSRFRNVGNIDGGDENFRGYGLLSEGLETNPVSYDMYNSRFVETTVDGQNLDDAELADWLEAYRLRRYGYTDDDLRAAHEICARTVWNCKIGQQGTVESVFCARPSYSVANVSTWGPTTGTPYDRQELVTAAEHYLAAAKAHGDLLDLETFRYDFVEIFQQLLADRAREILPQCATSARRRTEFRRFLELLDDILACSDEWRLDKKEARVAGKGGADAVAAYRRMITTWTPGARGQTVLSQYAHRSYAGLVTHYYARKWNAFFDQTEGTLTPAAYTARCNDLDAGFPTMTLEATPTDGDVVAIAEAILAAVIPAHVIWTGAAADGLFESANWENAFSHATQAWENGADATISGNGLTITARDPVEIGDLQLTPAKTAMSGIAGYISTEAVDTGLTGVTLEALAGDYEVYGTMAGGWVAAGEACGYVPTFNDAGDALTLQMQLSDGGYIKVVALTFTVVDDRLYVAAAWVRNRATSANSLGDDVSGLDNSTGNPALATDDAAAGYGIKALELRGRSCSLTLAGGPYTLSGDFTPGHATVAFTEGADISRLCLAAAQEVTFALPTAGTLAVAAVEGASGATIVLQGDADAFSGGAGSVRVKFPRDALAYLRYVDDEGDARSFRIDSEGYLRLKVQAQTYAPYVTAASTSLGWKGVTLQELAECAFTGEVNGGYIAEPNKGVTVRGYQIARDESALTVQMQLYDDGFTKVVNLAFTVNDADEVCVQGVSCGYLSGDHLGERIANTNGRLAESATADGYGICNLSVAPAVAQIDETKANYATLDEAVAAACGKTLRLLDDVALDARLTDGYPMTLVIPEGRYLAAPAADDFLYWENSWTLKVYGELQLGDYALSYAESAQTQNISLYGGGCIAATSGRGISVFEPSVIHVLAGETTAPARLAANLQLRKDAWLEVREGAVCVFSGALLDKGAQSGDANVTLTKTGAGVLELAYGSKAANIGLTLAEGTLRRTLAAGETLVLTIDGGTAEIVAGDADYKVVTTNEGNVYTYSCVAKDYLFYVTDPGGTSVNMPGTPYETFEEALAAARKLQLANLAEEVRLWIFSADKIDAAMAQIATYNAAHGTSYTQFGDGNGNEVQGWNAARPTGAATLYYTSEATLWDDTVTMAASQDGAAEVLPAADDVVVFDGDREWGPIYIADTVVSRRMVVKAGATLKPGFWNGRHSLPPGWLVGIEAGGAISFDNWADGKRVVVPDATFEGDGELTFGPTITSASSIEFGSVRGETKLTVPSACTVKVATRLENPVTLDVGAKLVAAPGAAVSAVAAAAGATLSVTTAEDGTVTYQAARNIYWASGIEWNTTGADLVVFTNAVGETVSYAVGDNVCLVDRAHNLWLGEPAWGASFCVSGGRINLQSHGTTKVALKGSTVTLGGGAVLNLWDQWNGVKFQDSTVLVGEGCSLVMADSVKSLVVEGMVSIQGPGTLALSKPITIASDSTAFSVPAGTAVAFIGLPEGYVVTSATAVGMTTYTRKKVGARLLILAS